MSSNQQASQSVFQSRQLELYQSSSVTRTEPIPISIAGLEEKARKVLEPAAFDYVAGGAGTEQTMKANLGAFHRYAIVPRTLRDVSHRDLTIDLFGHHLSSPIVLGPVGVLSILHPEGELAVGKAAASLGVPFVVSTVSSYSLEEIAGVMGQSPRWFQLYPSKDPEVNVSLMRRAEASGYTCVVITIDTRLLGWRPRDLDRAYLPMLKGEGLANYFTDPVFCSLLSASPSEDLPSAVRKWVNIGTDSSSTWERLKEWRSQTRLPLILKGILHPDDALRALDCGVDGIIVSNHGGRQVDGGVATLDMLPDVVNAVNGKAAVLFDSGIRCAADVFKAISLGARAVLIGRPYCWALAAAGERGICDMLRNFVGEFDLTLALSGYASCRGLDENALRLNRPA
ncbi:MAG: alpha-hydroxy-acid oxidizing protein [Acidobacteriota bacterium]|nr:alpha-hydroxy-acid oxidizing protein [Acidobacteriota bacterium]